MTTLDPRESGRRGRQSVKRSDLSIWNEGLRTHNALETLLAQNGIRVPELLAIRYGRMAASPWTYFRGAAAVMAADFGVTPNTGVKVQMCGDAHILNFGLWATPERNLAFDLRDFDETLPGPFEWDLKRLAASIFVLARENNVTDKNAATAITQTMNAYRDKMAIYSTTAEIDIWYDRIDLGYLLNFFKPDTADLAEKVIESKALRRTSRGTSRKLTETTEGHRRIREEPPFRTRVPDDQMRQITEIVAGYGLSIPDHIWSLLSRYYMSDVVRQVVGVGSVGMRVYLALLEERRTGDPFFLQVKQAGPSVYEKFGLNTQYTNHGERVVQGQRMLQSATDMFVGWTSVGGMDFYVRQFRDMKVIPDGAIISPYLAEFGTACAEVLARAHAKSGNATEISTYLGRSDNASVALTRFARLYADQNERDHAQLVAAIAKGSVQSAQGW